MAEHKTQRLENTVEINKETNAPEMPDHPVIISGSTSPGGSKHISLMDYVKRVRNMKNGVCFDQPVRNPAGEKE